MKIDDIASILGGSERFFHFVTETAGSGILITDSTGRVLFSNSRARELFGAGPALEGCRFEELFMEEDRAILAQNVVKIASDSGEFSGEVMLRRRDGTGFMAHLSLSSWRSADRGEGFLVAAVTDVSALKSIERRLMRSDRMIYLGQMLDDISHQIRNPVLAIGGFARRLLTTRLERPEYVRVIMEEAGRLEQLLDVLTRFIQLPKPRFSLYGADEVMEMVGVLAEEVCRGFGVGLERSVALDTDEPIATDVGLLKTAMEPVIVNGCEACMEAGGKGALHVRFEDASEPPFRLRITVQDSGMGIRPALMERIFFPFFTTKTGHLGMGLTFTKRILSEIEGTIRVDSVFSEGTRVSVELPGDRRRPIRTALVQGTS